jgi:hypothetical protein
MMILWSNIQEYLNISKFVNIPTYNKRQKQHSNTKNVVKVEKLKTT